MYCPSCCCNHYLSEAGVARNQPNHCAILQQHTLQHAHLPPNPILVFAAVRLPGHPSSINIVTPDSVNNTVEVQEVAYCSNTRNSSSIHMIMSAPSQHGPYGGCILLKSSCLSECCQFGPMSVPCCEQETSTQEAGRTANTKYVTLHVAPSALICCSSAVTAPIRYVSVSAVMVVVSKCMHNASRAVWLQGRYHNG